MSGLGALPALERLSAKGCGLNHAAGLQGLSAACKEINMSGNEINDLSGFAEAAASLTGLQTLSLAGNSLDSLDQLLHLAGLSSLTDLDLSDIHR